MTIVKEGYKVCILFEAKLENGETVLKTEEDKPIEVVIGEGSVPKSIETLIKDMKEGETKTVTLAPEEAFGPRINDLIIDLPKDGFQTDVDLAVGSRITLNSPDGKQFTGTIKEIKEKDIKIDFNHPFAGQTLEFTVTIVSVK